MGGPSSVQRSSHPRLAKRTGFDNVLSYPRVASQPEPLQGALVPPFAMSDLFISYSALDRPLVTKLAAELEGYGWSVWYDRNLVVGAPYRDDINAELVRARAVIVLWTKNSIGSDWVRAEAAKARADGKLIPLKTKDVDYADIPLPFGEMHTGDIGEAPQCVVNYLSKPQVSQPAHRLALKSLRARFLTWCGIAGGALTLFTNLGSVLALADWARAIILHWRVWTHAVWFWLLAWIGMSVPREITPALTFVAFTIMLAAGANLSSKEVPSSWHGRSRTRQLAISLAVYFFSAVVGIIWVQASRGNAVVGILGVVLLIFTTPMYLLYWSNNRWLCFAIIVLYISFSVIVFFIPTSNFSSEASDDQKKLLEHITFGGGVFGLQLLLIVLVTVSPLRPLTKRLTYLAFGLALLVILNEISKLNLHQYLKAPS